MRKLGAGLGWINLGAEVSAFPGSLHLDMGAPACFLVFGGGGVD